MPVHLSGAKTVTDFIGTKKIAYKYPEGLDLTPGSKMHTNLVSLVMDRAQESYHVIKDRHDSWNQVARSLSAYVRPDEKTKWEKKQVSSPVIVPVTFATLETILTYCVAAFLENPIFRYEGRSPEDVIGAILMQQVVSAQNDYSFAGLNLHTQWRDSFAFGFGATATRWTKTKGKRNVFTPERGRFAEFFAGAGNQRVQEDVTIFEGNEIINLDPFKYLPDPNVPIHDVQAGEYVGWYERDNRLSLLTQEKSDE